MRLSPSYAFREEFQPKSSDDPAEVYLSFFFLSLFPFRLTWGKEGGAGRGGGGGKRGLQGTQLC